ncbi:MAG: hypothetical protein IJE43_11190 [Alphaproteobacteria bacterium]|nr:hypothetical protein [Alphaproteobacteria bacterium]
MSTNEEKVQESLARIKEKKSSRDVILSEVDLSAATKLKFKEGANVTIVRDTLPKPLHLYKSKEHEALHGILDGLRDIVEENRPGAVAYAKERIEGKEICEIFQARIDALKKVNPKEFSDDTFLKVAAIIAQDYLKEENPLPTDKVDYKKMFEIEQRYTEPDWIQPLEVADLMSGYLNDIKKGVIDEKGNIIGNLKDSSVMDVWRGKSANLPKKALSKTTNMRASAEIEM